jgi:hypothetical protein
VTGRKGSISGATPSQVGCFPMGKEGNLPRRGIAQSLDTFFPIMSHGVLINLSLSIRSTPLDSNQTIFFIGKAYAKFAGASLWRTFGPWS